MTGSKKDVGYQSFIRRLIVIDGLVGGGKSMLGDILGVYPGVENWTVASQLEMICNLVHNSMISDDAAALLLNEYLYSLQRDAVFGRNFNPNLFDHSSMIKDPRKRYLRRIFNDVNKLRATLQNQSPDPKFVGSPCLMTHYNTQNSKILFKVFGSKLNYFWIIRQPATRYMIEIVASWIPRWKNGEGTNFQIKGRHGTHIPVTLANEFEDIYDKFDPIGKAILLIGSWLKLGKLVIDDAEKEGFQNNLAVVPFELFVTQPQKYIHKIASILGEEPDSVVRRMMKRHKVPRQTYHGFSANAFHSINQTNKSSDVSVEETIDWVRKSSSSDAAKFLETFQIKYSQIYLS